MSGFAERENNRERKSVVASMISETPKEKTTTGRGRPKMERETKKRISLAVLPSLYEDVKKVAYVERKSISEIVSACIEKYVADNESKLIEYEKIKKE
jgi:hypothetical protein